MGRTGLVTGRSPDASTGGRTYARIRVADTGAGIDPKILLQIFDPFFTTKGGGRGTGLGLAAVHGVVTSYGGAYCVESRPGVGTIDSVYLPLTTTGRPLVTTPVAADVHGRERILVDDEPNVLDMLSIGLERLGYEVAATTDPVEALQAFAEEPMAWDVVVSDQTMPGMTGLALIDKLRALRPGLRVILCTGFSDGTTEQSARELGADCLLKPVEPACLAARVRAPMT